MRIVDLPKYPLSQDEIAMVDRVIEKFKNKKGALIPVLQEIQKSIGFLPVEVQKKIAKELNIAEKEVYGVATFYSFFSMIPRGENDIRVCLGTACFVKGGKKIADKIQKELGIKPGQTTKDRKYSLQINRCLGACGLAPIIVINDKIYQKVKPEEVMDIIYSLDKE
ncbi:MAG: NADH-quinone oxidoreductase subunit NuoE [Actinobacteria bacterium]|nr:NADH-quinone oxidoreductase subunit NuoE [Actinomycetota bacterium]